jgi:flagellar biosynthetic protein FliO
MAQDKFNNARNRSRSFGSSAAGFLSRLTPVSVRRWAAVFALIAPLLAASPVAATQITDESIQSLNADPAWLNESKPLDSGQNLGQVFLRLGLSLGLVCGLIYLAAWAARKYLPAQVRPGGKGPIDIVASRAIGPRKSLLLVRVRDKTILLGLSAQGVQFLTDIDQGRGAWDEAAFQAGLHEVVSAEKE